jgi:hypothetical protein
VSFSITAGTGEETCTEPPGEVYGVGIEANKTTLYWSLGLGVDAYDVARGSVDGLAGGQPAVCIHSGATQPQYDDLALPVSGEAYYYLVRGANECGAGDWGAGSAGQSRSACP